MSFKRILDRTLFFVPLLLICAGAGFSGVAQAQQEIPLPDDVQAETVGQPLLPQDTAPRNIDAEEGGMATEPASPVSRNETQRVLDMSDRTAETSTSSVQPSEEDLAVPDIPKLAPQQADEENIFYDAESLVPSSDMARSGPRKVNPRMEPGSKFIVVKKNHGADSHTSQRVAAERAMKLGRYESALEIYDHLYVKNKKDPNVLLGRASAYQHLGQTDAAIIAYEELLSIRPDNLEAQINMLGLMSSRYPSVALRRLADLRNKYPNSAGVAAQIAVVQAELGNYSEAIQYLGVASSIEPRNAGHLFNMAVIADRSGHKTEAVRYYEEALEIDTVYGGGRTIPRDAVFERLAQIR